MAQDFNFSCLSWIEPVSDNHHLFPVESKFFERLNAKDKNKVLTELIGRKPQIFEKLELIRNDVEYSKIKTYLEKRFEFVVDQLNKK